MLRDCLWSAVAAGILGAVFGKLGVNCPAPTALPGVVGVAACTLGYWLAS